MKFRILSLAVVVLLIYACSPKVAPVPSEPPPTPVVAASLSPELAEGKTLYENNCAKCHRLYDSREYSAQEWGPILTSMQTNAGIDDSQKAKIYNYLTRK